MKSLLWFLIAMLLAAAGCLNVSAPEKIEVNADTGNAKWNRTAQKYVSQYAGSSRSDRSASSRQKYDD